VCARLSLSLSLPYRKNAACTSVLRPCVTLKTKKGGAVRHGGPVEFSDPQTDMYVF